MIDEGQKQKLESIATLISRVNDMVWCLLGEMDAERDFYKGHLIRFVQPTNDDGEKK